MTKSSTEKAGEAVWPTQLADLPPESPLRHALVAYAARMGFRMRFKGSLEEEAVPAHIRETARTALHALRVTQKGEKPVAYRESENPRWARMQDIPSWVETEQATYAKPLNDRNVKDAMHSDGFTLGKIVCAHGATADLLSIHPDKREGQSLDAQSSPRTVEQAIGSILYDFRTKAIILWSLAIREEERTSGLAEQLLVAMISNLKEERRVLVDFIDHTHEHAAQAGERSLRDACTLLVQLGFKNMRDEDSPHAYVHKVSECIILLSNALDSSKLSPSDALSMSTKLDGFGILEEADFNRFLKEGWFPKGPNMS